MNKQKKKTKRKVKAIGARAEVPETPPPDRGTMKNGGEHKRLERRRVINEDLQLELATLRQTVRDMLARFQLKLDAEFVQLTEAASGNGAFSDNSRRLPIAVAENMIKQIRALDIKPDKGRAKDLQRVQDLIGGLIEQLP